MAREIVLAREGGQWTAAFLDAGAPERSVVELFGTHIIPTGFLERARVEVVLREIRALNPEYTVTALVEGRVLS